MNAQDFGECLKSSRKKDGTVSERHYISLPSDMTQEQRDAYLELKMKYNLPKLTAKLLEIFWNETEE